MLPRKGIKMNTEEMNNIIDDNSEQKKNQTKKPTRRKKKMIPTLRITIFSVIIAVLCGLYAGFLINNYERGVAEIYAVEQDGYVQLVLDQINLQDETADASTIQSILATLDSSSNKYWTLSNDDTLVFVKDVLETSRYKSFTTDTYYNTVSSREFVNNLSTDKVTHETVLINDSSYIASGVRFTHGGKQYRICLLTNSNIMLENNTYLSTKIDLIIMIIVILLTFIILMIILSRIVNSQRRQLDEALDEQDRLRLDIEKLGERLEEKNNYDIKATVFGNAVIPTMLAKIDERGTRPVTLSIVSYDKKTHQILIGEGQNLLGKNVIRMNIDIKHMLLIFLNTEFKDTISQLDVLKSLNIEVDEIAAVRDKDTLTDTYKKMLDSLDKEINEYSFDKFDNI